MHTEVRHMLMSVPEGLERKILVYRNNSKSGNVDRENKK